ncbi:MAG: hypothetical protein CML66_05835 [Rhodobacteraceae bacterium]|nr:hypothetical protein [Paracoccaceae bacterium]MAY46523.1 hypothetical protein [Paracoccaceae bacterium]
MTNEQPACGNETGLPKLKTLGDCQTDAIVLAGILEAVDLMLSENSGSDGMTWRNAIASVVTAARKRADDLADDLDLVKA